MIAAKTQQKHQTCSYRGARIRTAGATVVRLVPAARAVGAGRAGLHVAVPVGRVRSRRAVAERARVVAGGAAALAAAAVVAAAQGMRLPPARVIAETTRRGKVAAIEGRGGGCRRDPGDRSGNAHERLIIIKKYIIKGTRFVRGLTRCHGSRDEHEDHEHCAPGASWRTFWWRKHMERYSTRVWSVHDAFFVDETRIFLSWTILSF